MDDIALKSARPPLAADGTESKGRSAREHKMAFDAYVRGGETANLRALESKALSAGSNPDGGYLVPSEVEQAIGRRLAEISPIRAIAAVRTVSAGVYKKPFMTSGPAVGWVGETDARAQTASPTLSELSFPAMELYAMPAATATLLDDSAVNIDEWIASEVDQAFAEQEGAAFVTGDGSNKPKGFLAYATVANGSWSWGNLGYIASGAAGAFPASNPADVLIDFVYALRSGYRQNAVFVMNRKTQSVIRKFKDAGGQYLWAPGLHGGRAGDAAGLPGRHRRQHAGHRRQRARHRLRRFPPRLSRGRPRGRARAARSVLRQALRAVLHHQARRRRRAGLRGDQADEVRGELSGDCGGASSLSRLRERVPERRSREAGEGQRCRRVAEALTRILALARMSTSPASGRGEAGVALRGTLPRVPGAAQRVSGALQNRNPSHSPRHGRAGAQRRDPAIPIRRAPCVPERDARVEPAQDESDVSGWRTR